MKKIEAPSMNEALIKASEELGVSVTEIEYEIIQEPSKGFFGFGKKPAIIVASIKEKQTIPVVVPAAAPEPTPAPAFEPPKRPKVKIVSKARDRALQEAADVEPKADYNISRSEDEIYENFFHEDIEAPQPFKPRKAPESSYAPEPKKPDIKPEKETKPEIKETIPQQKPAPEPKYAPPVQDSKPKTQHIEPKIAESAFVESKPVESKHIESKTTESRYAETKFESKPKKPFNPLPIAELREHKDIEEAPHEGKKRSPSELASIASQVQKEINELFGLMPFNINPIKVSVFDDHTLFIEFHGEDAALLIGKEGYRYKALSYMLFHWINTRHRLMVRLEIAEFLHNQELMIAHYLTPVIEMIKETGKGQTRPLDGVLAYIALRQLRDTFPDKYVSFRKTPDGGKYVIVNEFYH